MHLKQTTRLRHILIISHQYDPVVGGVPVVARLLARELILSRNVRLLTATASESMDDEPYAIVRSRSPVTAFVEFARADAVIMIGPSIRTAWPAFLSRKPVIVSHQAGVTRGLAQQLLAARVTNVACSKYLAKEIGAKVIAIGNPFDSAQFNLPASDAPPRDRDWVCVARLVQGKGVDIFLTALNMLRQGGWAGTATVIGDGPEEIKLKALATRLNLDSTVEFVGPLTGRSLAGMIQRHHTGVVPSRWEPFGIVALELLACGCSVIGARVGGLPEAMGHGGISFEAENPQSLADAMAKITRGANSLNIRGKSTDEHLAKYRPSYVAARYMRLLEGLSIGGPR
jgi:glycogen synthase